MILAALQNMDRIDPELWTQINARMEPETAERVRAAVVPRKGLVLAAGRDLARRLAASALGVPPENVRLAHEKDGRPFLLVCRQAGPERPALEVSISHSDPYLLSAVSDAGIACDIQTIRHFPLEALSGFFAEADLQCIRRAEDPDRMLCRLWCRQECLIKRFGRSCITRQLVLCDTAELRKQFGIHFLEDVSGEDRCLCLAWTEAAPALADNQIEWRQV